MEDWDRGEEGGVGGGEFLGDEGGVIRGRAKKDDDDDDDVEVDEEDPELGNLNGPIDSMIGRSDG